MLLLSRSVSFHAAIGLVVEDVFAWSGVGQLKIYENAFFCRQVEESNVHFHSVF